MAKMRFSNSYILEDFRPRVKKDSLQHPDVDRVSSYFFRMYCSRTPFERTSLVPLMLWQMSPKLHGAPV